MSRILCQRRRHRSCRTSWTSSPTTRYTASRMSHRTMRTERNRRIAISSKVVQIGERINWAIWSCCRWTRRHLGALWRASSISLLPSTYPSATKWSAHNSKTQGNLTAQHRCIQPTNWKRCRPHKLAERSAHSKEVPQQLLKLKEHSRKTISSNISSKISIKADETATEMKVNIWEAIGDMKWILK